MIGVAREWKQYLEYKWAYEAKGHGLNTVTETYPDGWCRYFYDVPDAIVIPLIQERQQAVKEQIEMVRYRVMSGTGEVSRGFLGDIVVFKKAT